MEPVLLEHSILTVKRASSPATTMTLTRSGPGTLVVISVVALALLGGCSPPTHPPEPKTDSQFGVEGMIRFENRQPQSQIDFVLNNGTTAEKHMIDSILGGVACFDLDGDEFLDIFFTNGGRIPSIRKDNESFHNRLYRNNQNGQFTNVTEYAKLSGKGYRWELLRVILTTMVGATCTSLA